ncbi:hypothetical protein FOA52_002361 [Chlamydomonas sp. UWO 241]|nr:hypothetical protein FOA52_002361 [Chlamydomonas sp. UWO 241]
MVLTPRKELKALVKALSESTNPAKQLSAAEAVCELTDNRDNEEALVEAGAIVSLSALLVPVSRTSWAAGAPPAGGSSPQLKRLAATSLFNLAGQNADSIAAAGAIPPLVQMLGTHSPPEVQAPAAACLARLVEVPDIAYDVAKAGAIPRLVRLLGDSSQETRESVAFALVNLSTRQAGHQHEFHESGALPGLVALLEASNSAQLKMSGCATLGNLALNAKAPGAVRAAGAIPPIVRLLRASTPPEVLLHAARAVISFTSCPPDESAGNMAALMAASVIPQLVHLLVPGSSLDLLDTVMGALANLGHDEDAMVAIVAAGAIPPLVQLLDTPVCGSAAGVLQELTCSVDKAATVAAAGALPKLVRMLGSEFPSEVHEKAAGALANLSRPEAWTNDAVACAKAIPALVALLRSAPSSPCDAGTYAQLMAVEALINLAQGSTELQAAITAAGVVPALECLLQQLAHAPLGELQAGVAELLRCLTGDSPPVTADDGTSVVPSMSYWV